MPMPKPVCRTNVYNKIVQLEVCRTFSGRGMGINGTAQYRYCYNCKYDDNATNDSNNANDNDDSP